ncbi:hypothetical protein D6833_08280 [Candidatus Parcubacteria bacterium]|nr:MAG: hypothetical protein D6833_08280 [Candidatus Parcubacteria bacterium]
MDVMIPWTLTYRRPNGAWKMRAIDDNDTAIEAAIAVASCGAPFILCRYGKEVLRWVPQRERGDGANPFRKETGDEGPRSR